MSAKTKNAGNFPPLDYCDQEDCSRADQIIHALEVLLVAEDNGFSQAMGSFLQDQGYQVYLAPDVGTAVEELANYNFDLLIVQLGRNDQAGLAAVHQARRLKNPPKIMVLCGPQGKMLPVEAFEVEVDDYLIFPFSTAEFSRRLAVLAGPVLRAGGSVPVHRFNARMLDNLVEIMEEIRQALHQAAAALQGFQGREAGCFNEGEPQMLDEIMARLSQAVGLAGHFDNRSAPASHRHDRQR